MNLPDQDTAANGPFRAVSGYPEPKAMPPLTPQAAHPINKCRNETSSPRAQQVSLTVSGCEVCTYCAGRAITIDRSAKRFRARRANRRMVILTSYHWTALVLFLMALPACAQSFNFNFGAGPGFPFGTTADFVHNSYDLVVGGGLNLRAHIKMDTEFMFHGIPVDQDIIKQVGVSNIKGRLYSLSGNLMIGTSTSGAIGAYLIGGGGWYRRTLEAKQTVLQRGTVCAPFWEWWNVQCVDGIYPTDVTVGSRTVSAPGFNIGGGLTFGLGESPANLYIEVRYHRAFTRSVDTVVLPITFGVRF